MSDMTDASGQMPRRGPRVSDGGAPVSGAVAIVLAVVAVVAGFLILNSISDGGDAALDFPAEGAGTGSGDDSQSTDPSQTSTTVPGSTSTTLPPIVTDGASVVVANANGQGGSAGSMKRALETGPGFTVVAAVDAGANVGDLAESVIYYDESNAQALPVATSLGEVLGGVASIGPLADPAPTIDGDMHGGHVLLMLGDDKANKPLEELNPELNGTGGASQLTSPPIAAESTTTTTVAD